MRRFLTALAVLALGCGEEIDPSGLPSTKGYETWPAIQATGYAPGHGDTYRIIFANPVAGQYAGGRYSPGTVIVKEIRENAGGRPGEILYLAIMRKLAEGTPAPAPVDRGWLFTDLRGGVERQKPTCFRGCHLQGPFDYAWFDYGR